MALALPYMLPVQDMTAAHTVYTVIEFKLGKIENG